MRKLLLGFLIVFLSIFILNSCLNEELEREILMGSSEAIEIGYLDAELGGQIIDFGEGVDQYGHCWSVNPLPTINDSISIVHDNFMGSFKSNLKNLHDNTLYYFRSYAKKGNKVSYSDENTFITKECQLPIISINSLNIETNHSISVNLKLDNLGGYQSILDYGVCWSETVVNPNIEDNCIRLGSISEIGNLMVLIENLDSTKKYFVRAFAINNKGISYSQNYSVIMGISVSEGLVAYYPLDGDANDYSGNNYHLINYGADFVSDRINIERGASYFNGASGLILKNQTFTNQSNHQTISLWFKTSSLNSVAYGGVLCAIAGSSTVGAGSRFYITIKDGKLWCQYGDEYGEDNLWVQIIESQDTYHNNQWHHVVFVASGDNGFARLIIDGIVKNEESLYKSNNEKETGLDIKIGGDRLENYYNGIIDDVRIYNRMLSEEEILTLYHEGGWK